MKHASSCILIGVLAASLSLPAHAAWESVYTTGKTFGAGYDGKKSNCSQDQSTGPAAVRNTPGARLVLGGGPSRLDQSSVEYLEVYGQGIDLSLSATLTGLTPPPKIADRINGAYNAAHFCGAIGSMVIEINPPTVAQDTTATLNIGNEMIPITVVSQNRVSTGDWPRSNISQGRTESGAAGPVSPGRGNTAVSVGASTHDCTPGVNCPEGGGTTSLVVLQDNRPPAEYISFGRCLNQIGGSASLSLDLLTLVLPDVRTELASCFRYPLLAGITMVTSTPAATSSAITNPRVSVSPESPAVQATFIDETRARENMVGYNQAGVELLLPASEYLGFTGRRIHTLTATGAGGTTRSLRFAVQSVTPAGITAIRAPISVQGLTGRPNNTMTFNLTLAQPAEAGQRFSWQLGAGSTAVAPATCFTATTGTESPPVGAATVPVTLTISGNAASCDGRNFTLTTQPAGTTAAIYQRSQGFTVLPLIAVRDPGSPPPTVVPNVIRP